MPRKIAFTGALAAALALAAPAFAQLTPAPPDPLAGMRAAAAANPQVCTNSETSACAQANPKILAAAMGSTAIEENLRTLAAAGSGTPDMDTAMSWAVRAFRTAGVDAVSAEGGYTDPAIARGEKSVIAEIHGREKPEEFVFMAANLEDVCNAALLMEAARDIHLTGLRPRRSIRFVLFGGKTLGAWAYTRKHQSELDHAVAAVSFEDGCARVAGFDLAGRQDLEPGVREALDFAPIKSWGIADDTYSAAASGYAFDFLLQGVPALTANRQTSASSSEVDIEAIKKNAAIASVFAFGLAEHATPLGSRLSRAEVEALLKRTGLDAKMRETDVWRQWESGQRGRQP